MIRNIEDVWKFCDWMYKNEGREISVNYRLLILNNLIESYYILYGDKNSKLLNTRCMSTKKQIQLMWNYIDEKYKKRNEL